MTKAEFDRRVDALWSAIVARAEREYAAAQAQPQTPPASYPFCRRDPCPHWRGYCRRDPACND